MKDKKKEHIREIVKVYVGVFLEDPDYSDKFYCKNGYRPEELLDLESIFSKSEETLCDKCIGKDHCLSKEFKQSERS